MQSLNNLQDIPLGPSRETPCRLTNGLLLSACWQSCSTHTCTRRKQVQVECKHLTCGSGHCALGNLLGLLGHLKISLESSFHCVFGHLGCFFSFLGFWLGIWDLCKGFLGGFLGLCKRLFLAILFVPALIPSSRASPAYANSTACLTSSWAFWALL